MCVACGTYVFISVHQSTMPLGMVTPPLRKPFGSLVTHHAMCPSVDVILLCKYSTHAQSTHPSKDMGSHYMVIYTIYSMGFTKFMDPIHMLIYLKPY